MLDKFQSIPTLLNRLWVHIDPRRKRQLLLLLVLMVLSSFAEVISIGAVLPFLAVLAAPSQVLEYSSIQPLIKVFAITSADQFLLAVTIMFSAAVVMAGIMRIVLLKLSIRISFSAGADLSANIYKRTLYQPYLVHLSRNSSKIINGISVNSSLVIAHVITPVLTLISSSLMIGVILTALLIYDPFVACILFGGLSVLYGLIMVISRKSLIFYSERISIESVRVIKSLQEGLGGVRDVLLDGSQKTYTDIYNQADETYRSAQGNIQFIGQSPRYVFEALGILLITIFAYILAKSSSGVTNAIPILGAFALGAQRLLPVIQQAYNSWSAILGCKLTLQETLSLLDQPLPENFDKPVIEPVAFNNVIRLRNLSFSYTLNGKWTLNNINLNIVKGSRVGIIGQTGSGKSTLVDLLMGLLQPTKGLFTVDELEVNAGNSRNWQAHIAHVPQAIYLSDSSIAENIAFGVPKNKIDTQRVRMVAEQAKISESIESWPMKYKTLVGERGVRLSGGQRQRIGIARALYKQADVIIFDEATNALDNDTEQAVMSAIDGLNKELTIIIVAHRLSTLSNCNQIIELSEGEIIQIGSYDEIVSPSIDFKIT